MNERIRELVREKPEYEKILRKLLAHQEKHVEGWKEREEDLDIDGPFFGFEYSDVKIQPAKLNFLSAKGILEKVYGSSNKPNQYRIAEPEKVRTVLEGKEEAEKSTEVKPVPEEEAPGDIFSPIVGLDDIKWLFKKSIKGVRDHILLVGPPSTAKTTLLLELGRLPNASYVLGHSTTAPGLTDQLFELKPRYVLIDEIDKMDRSDYGVLLSLMEDGRVKETKSGKTREMTLDSNVYAAANKTENIPPELLSRFEELRLPEYSDSKFVKVCKRLLVKRENVSEERSEYIARKALEVEKDIRVAIRIARTCETTEEIGRRIRTIKTYS